MNIGEKRILTIPSRDAGGVRSLYFLASLGMDCTIREEGNTYFNSKIGLFSKIHLINGNIFYENEN